MTQHSRTLSWRRSLPLVLAAALSAAIPGTTTAGDDSGRQGVAHLIESAGAAIGLPVTSSTEVRGTLRDGTPSIEVRLELPADFLAEELSQNHLEEMLDYMGGELNATAEGARIEVLARPEGDTGAAWVPITSLAKPLPRPMSKEEQFGVSGDAATRGGQQPGFGQPQANGFLAGKSVFISPGHGWFWDGSSWLTQRPLTSNGIIEDHHNADMVYYWVSRYLWNSGAGVYNVRERDKNPVSFIIDDGASGYSTTGTWTSESLSGTNDGDHQWATTVTGAPTATATFTPNITSDSTYSVYVHYRPSAGGTTTTDAEIIVNHSGGSTTVIQDQNRDGYTWKYIGDYYFEAGTSGSVVVTNSSSTAGNRVIADAVRIGGGMGVMSESGGPISGELMYEESGQYYAGFMGKSDWESFGTVSGMPSYAAWESEGWEDSVYVSLHTDAGGTSARGTLGITYANSWPTWVDDSQFAGVPGGLELRDFITDEMVFDIRDEYDPTWVYRSPANAAYGEVNPSTNPDMPATIIEVGFHSGSDTDELALLDPRLRQIAGRAVYQGIVRYYADKDGVTPQFLPEPPTDLSVVNDGSGSIVLDWEEPVFSTGTGRKLYGDAATGYKVYRSTNGYGFDNGTVVSGGSNTTATISSGLTPGETYYFKVAATNPGGESFPTETLAVTYEPASTNPILIVTGYDRLDRRNNTPDAQGSLRPWMEFSNSYDYAIDYAASMEAYGVAFDSASNEAVESGQVSLGAYTAVFWSLGEESTVDDTFSTTEQTVVTTYLNGGGKLFASGSEIGWQLNAEGGTSFLNNTLKTTYVGDDANTYQATGTAGAFAGIGSITFDNGAVIYDVDWPDRYAPTGGSIAVMSYVGGTGDTAAIQYDGTYQLLHLGFPWEAIVNRTQRDAVMAAALDFFGFSGMPPVSDLIFEVRDPSGNPTAGAPTWVENGTWQNSSGKSTAAGLAGSGSRFSGFSGTGDTGDNAVWTPNIATGGQYEVFVTWSSTANALNVRYAVNHGSGTAEVFLDQIPIGETGANHDQWISLGTFDFPAGQDPNNGSVTVDESTVTGALSTGYLERVYVDSFRMEYVGPSPSRVSDWETLGH